MIFVTALAARMDELAPGMEEEVVISCIFLHGIISFGALNADSVFGTMRILRRF